MTKFTLTPPWSSPLRWCGCFCGRGHQRRCRAQGQQCSTAWQWHQRRRRTLPLTWSPTVGTHQFSGQSCHTLGTWCTHFPDWNTQHMHLESLRHVSFFLVLFNTHSLLILKCTPYHRHMLVCWALFYTCSFLCGMQTIQTDTHIAWLTHVSLFYCLACTPSRLKHTIHQKTHVSLLECLACTLSRLKHTSWLAARQITTHNATQNCFVL